MSTFEKLKGVDCSQHVEKKGKFTYLSWAWAWATLKEHAPDATFHKHTFGEAGSEKPFMLSDDGFAYVMVTVTVEGSELTEIMPVLNHSNKPIANPNSFDVNTALQRCLVKAIAFHGLGLYIYAGEDLPDIGRIESAPDIESHTADQKTTFDHLITNGNDLDLFVFSKTIRRAQFASLYNSFPKGEITKYKKIVDSMGMAGKEMFDKYLSLMQEATHNQDDAGMIELSDELSPMALTYIKDQL